MRKFLDTVGTLIPWVCVVMGFYMGFFHNDYEKATHSYVTALVLWKVNEIVDSKIKAS